MDTKETLKGNGNVAIHDWLPYNEQGEHKDADEIETDIEETRHTMDEILDRLADKISPNSIVNRLKNSLKKTENREKAKDIAYEMANRISDSFQRNPLPVMMIAAGATWQLWEMQRKKTHPQSTEESLGSMRNAAEDTFSRAKDTAKNKFPEAKEGLKERVSSVRDNIENRYRSQKEYLQSKSDQAASFKSRSGELREQAIHSYKDTIHKTDRTFRDNSLLLGGAAIFAGLLLGSLLPETKTEKQAARGKAEDFSGKAMDTGEQILDKGRETAQETARTAAQKLDEKELTPDKMTSKAERKVTQEPAHRAEEPRITSTERQQPVSENISNVLKTAEQKIDEKKNK